MSRTYINGCIERAFRNGGQTVAAENRSEIASLTNKICKNKFWNLRFRGRRPLRLWRGTQCQSFVLQNFFSQKNFIDDVELLMRCCYQCNPQIPYLWNVSRQEMERQIRPPPKSGGYHAKQYRLEIINSFEKFVKVLVGATAGNPPENHMFDQACSQISKDLIHERAYRDVRVIERGVVANDMEFISSITKQVLCRVRNVGLQARRHMKFAQT